MSYVELQVTTNFSFLRGASHPAELFEQAAKLGIDTLGVVDRNTLAGVVRCHVEAKKHNLRFILGCRLDLHDGASVLVYPTDLAAYSRLCRLLTVGKHRGGKGQCILDWDDLFTYIEGQIVILVPDKVDDKLRDDLKRLRQKMGTKTYLALTLRRQADDKVRLHQLSNLASQLFVKTVATNDVLYHVPERRYLQDIVTCIREKATIDDLGYKRERYAERQLKTPEEMARLFRDYPEAVTRTNEIADRCKFSLAEIHYQYPDEHLVPNLTAQQALERFTWEKAKAKYPDGIPDKVQRLLHHELNLIGELTYAPYFLTVYRIVEFASSQGIVCQGRGSAANSAVCYVLGVTSVDPLKCNLLFERFISKERNEPPDIDIDFDAERREEVIQWIYNTYKRDHSALTAVVSRYRADGAIRDVGKAMGLSTDEIDKLNREMSDIHGQLRAGADAYVETKSKNPRIVQTMGLVLELQDFPRHTSQHPGGFVLTHGRLDDLVPIEPARMEDRQIIEWDKDDIDVLKFMKVDILGLGGMELLRRCFALLREYKNIDMDLATIPQDDTATYDMICEADTVGTFQIESRAQMTMLPKLKPRNFHDIVVEISLVRPGPIQGGMVAPYIARRRGLEPVPELPSELDEILGTTLGVPIFQEQIMALAVKGGFTPGEANELRRSMATFKNIKDIDKFKAKFIAGVSKYGKEFAERCWSQVHGFGSYGFPQSHAWSFARIVWATSYLKCHYPDAFCAAILNAQPMGFYAPDQLARDAKLHNVEVRGVDINFSHWECTLEATEQKYMAVRLGLGCINGLKQAEAELLVKQRNDKSFYSVADFFSRVGLSSASLEQLANANAFRSLGLNRRSAAWAFKGQSDKEMPLFAAANRLQSFLECMEPVVALPPSSRPAEIVEDYNATNLTLGEHPMSFLRQRLTEQGVTRAVDLPKVKCGTRVTVAGVVLFRQQPGTSKGVIFETIEDETGKANIIVWPTIKEKFRHEVIAARLLKCTGRIQKDGPVIHIIAEHMQE